MFDNEIILLSKERNVNMWLRGLELEKNTWKDICQNIKFSSSLFLVYSMLSVLPTTTHEYYLWKKKFLKKPQDTAE